MAMSDPNDFALPYIMAIERALIERLKMLLGRVPTNAEVAANCSLLTWPDGRREYQWRGQTILRVDALYGAKWKQP